jgi:hypothetical protein
VGVLKTTSTCNSNYKHFVASFTKCLSYKPHFSTLAHDSLRVLASPLKVSTKVWFKVVSETMLWNVLEFAKIDYKLYLHAITIHGLQRKSSQKHFEFEIFCLKSCLHASELIAYDFNLESYKDSSLQLNIPRLNKTF